MIEELDFEKLSEYGFNKLQIERLNTWKDYTTTLFINNKIFIASNIENKIYSGNDAGRIYFFQGATIAFPSLLPDLLPEFYKLTLTSFLIAQKNITQSLYDEFNETERFIEHQIKITEKDIEETTQQPILYQKNAYPFTEIRRSYVSFLQKQKVSILKVNNTNRNKKITTYSWVNNPEIELLELFQFLKNDNLIAKETTFEQFKPIFTGVNVDEITPIKWHEDNASEVLYFINKISESGNINTKTRADYHKLKSCFVKPDGSIFNANFKELKQSLSISLSQNKQDVINRILNNF